LDASPTTDPLKLMRPMHSGQCFRRSSLEVGGSEVLGPRAPASASDRVIDPCSPVARPCAGGWNDVVSLWAGLGENDRGENGKSFDPPSGPCRIIRGDTFE